MMNTPIVKPPTREQLHTQVRWLEAEIERLRGEIESWKALVRDCEGKIERLIEAAVEVERADWIMRIEALCAKAEGRPTTAGAIRKDES
jgi:hypothetical protein